LLLSATVEAAAGAVAVVLEAAATVAAP